MAPINSTTVFINGRFLLRRLTGVDRFAFETLRAIDSLIDYQDSSIEKLRFEIIVPESAEVESPYAHIPLRKFGRHQGQLWEQFDLPRAVGDGILLNLCNTAPVVLRRQVTVIHDAATAAIPAAFSASFRIWYRVLMPLLGYQCREILTVSQFSKNELIRHFRVPKKKVSVVIEGGEHFLRTEADHQALERIGLGQRPFVLAVSSMAAHKNFRQVLAALDLIGNPPFDVAIAGGANSKVFGTGGALGSDRVHWLGYVSDSELRALYEGAMAFVFPSVYEGFGIPPLEAMNCGCPVIASKAASIPEVCGEAALYFDPSDPQELADLLLRVAEDASLRDSLQQKGRSRAALFSWQQTAYEVIAACRRASE